MGSTHSGAGAPDGVPKGTDRTSDPTEAFRDLEDLISSEENVEYEEEEAFEVLKHPASLAQKGFGNGPAAAPFAPSRAEGRVSIPIRIRSGGGKVEEYRLDVAVSLHKAEAGSSGEDVAVPPLCEEEGELEIDLLDGRTTLILDEDEPAESAGDPLEEEEETNWVARIFRAWKQRAGGEGPAA